MYIIKCAVLESDWYLVLKSIFTLLTKNTQLLKYINYSLSIIDWKLPKNTITTKEQNINMFSF